MSGKNSGMSDRATEMMSPPTAPYRRDDTDATALQQAQTSPFDAELREALNDDRISDARTLVAKAEAVLAGHDAASENVSRANVAAAKVRIALATGDDVAARAILVQAIEAAPKVAMLRALMTEVMMANGRASDVRPVLQHLGTTPQSRQDSSSVSADATHPKHVG